MGGLNGEEGKRGTGKLKSHLRGSMDVWKPSVNFQSSSSSPGL